MKVKDQFLELGSFQLNNGHNIRFWEDRWIGNFTLQQRYPSLYSIVRRKQVSVATVFSTIPLNISFRRGLRDQNLVFWHDLIASVAHVVLNDTTDIFKWNLQ